MSHYMVGTSVRVAWEARWWIAGLMTGDYGRVRSVCVEVEGVASPKVMRAGYSGAHR